MGCLNTKGTIYTAETLNYDFLPYSHYLPSSIIFRPRPTGLVKQAVGDSNMKLRVIRWVIVVLLWLSFGPPSGVAASQEIQWHSYNAGMARGKFEKKKVFIHFYAEWCAACKAMENSTFKDPVVIASLNEYFIPIKVDADREVQTTTMFRVKGLPDNWFITENGEIIGHRPGYIPPDQLKDILTLIQNQKDNNQ